MAALNPLYSFDQIPTTSAAAIREFNDRYLAAIGASVPSGWADTLGELVATDRPMVTFPVSQMRTLYKRTEGESRFKSLGEASFDVKTEEFDDGYQAKVKDLFNQLFAYRHWQQAPQRLVLAEEQFRHTAVAALLTAGTSKLCVDGQNFFSTAHPANITDSTITSTYSNYNSVATNVLGSTATANTGGTHSLDNLQNEVTSMQTQVLDENGLLLGVDPDTILCPYDYYEPLKNMLARERVLEFITNGAVSGNNPIGAAATDNFYKGRFNIVPVREFSIASGTTADWYLVDSKMVKAGISPWVIMRETVPSSLALRVFDEQSDFFKNTGSIKLSSHIWYGFSLALPQAIRRVKGPTR
jgi:hypothetical protein